MDRKRKEILLVERGRDICINLQWKIFSIHYCKQHMIVRKYATVTANKWHLEIYRKLLYLCSNHQTTQQPMHQKLKTTLTSKCKGINVTQEGSFIEEQHFGPLYPEGHLCSGRPRLFQDMSVLLVFFILGHFSKNNMWEYTGQDITLGKQSGWHLKRGSDRVTHYQVEWKGLHTVEKYGRSYLFSTCPYPQCWHYSCRQNRHNSCGTSQVNCALVTVCLVDIASVSSAVGPVIFLPFLSPSLSPPLVLSLLPSTSCFCLIFSPYHFRGLFHHLILPFPFFFLSLSLSLPGCQFSRLAPLAGKVSMCFTSLLCV